MLFIDTGQRWIRCNGVSLSLEMFEFLGERAKPGQLFKFVERKRDGVVVIERINADTPTSSM